MCSKNAQSQCNIPAQYSGVPTGASFTGMILHSFIQSLNISSDSAYLVVTSSDGLVVGSTCVSDSCLDPQGQTQLTVWGDDTFTPQIDGAINNDTLTVQLVDGFYLQDLSITFMTGSSDLVFSVNGIEIFSIASVVSSCYYDMNTGCTDSIACNYNSEATSDDGSCELIDGICDSCENGIIIDNDSDGDGICNNDEVAGCQDSTACNFNLLATDPPIAFPIIDSTWVYTDSTFSDSVLYVPVNPADCTYEDSDEDGVCDIFEVLGCKDTLACNYDSNPTTDSDASLCLIPTGCASCSGAQDGTGILFDNDIDGDGVCNDDEIVGCENELACDFNSLATDSASCLYPVGCESCSGAQDGTGIIVDNDSDDDGVCNADEVLGCTDSLACNYNDLATDNDDCLSFDSCGDCGGNGNCPVFIQASLIFSVAQDLLGSSSAILVFQTNFESLMETQLGLPQGCVVVVNIIFISRGDVEVEVIYTISLTEEEIQQSNIDSTLTSEQITDLINQEILVVQQDYLLEDIQFIEGCIDSNACNYNLEANIEAICSFSSDLNECASCSGAQDGSGVIVDNDSDNDGVCNENEIFGCTDNLACNYDSTSTTDTNNTICIYSSDLDECASCSGAQDGTGSIIDNDPDSDGICTQDEVLGCTNLSACNFDQTPTTDTNDSLCIFPFGCETCSGSTNGTGYIIDNDLDDDGICNSNEVLACTDILACNYNESPTIDTDNSLCQYSADLDLCASCSGSSNGLGYIVDNDLDNDGVCDQDEVLGCMSSFACNYNPLATDDDGSCSYPIPQYDCNGDCLLDFDSDGVCDIYEVLGCTNIAYLEYDSLATEDNGLCETIIVEGCMDDSYIEFNPNANISDSSFCMSLIILGCIDTTACNFNINANTSDDSCQFVDGICDTCEDGVIVSNDIDSDGVCNSDEIQGCTDDLACNYYETPTTDTDNSLCIYSTDLDECATCSGETDGTGTIIDNDSDGDGVCNSDEILGCTDTLACNYDATPTTDSDNSLCIYSNDLDDCSSCSGEIDGTGTVIDNDFDNDGVCDDQDYDDGIGIDELENDTEINLYPNPSKDFINISFQSDLLNLDIEILNSIGAVVMTSTFANVYSEHTIQIDVHNLPNGLYFLRATSENQLHRLPWLKN